jgi:PAS domain S-box-containing protein
MLIDSDPAVAPEREVELHHHDGTIRLVKVVDREVPYPEGKLIVSRTDRSGIITHANPAFIEMSGYSREELIGQPHAILRHPDMPALAFADLWETVMRGEPWHGHVKNLRKDGLCYWVHATVIANIRAGEVVGYTSVRRKPSRQRVNECIEHYRRMCAEESGS